MNIFEKLFKINVNNYTEKKDGLTYLSWTYAWAEVKKIYPSAEYKIRLFGEEQLPYVYDKNTGYMVFTDVTIEGITHTMWLPVMNSANKAMKSEPYTYDTKYKKGIKVEAATMFDINKTIMRCLVKNLAMFGLGLYIYAGEDLPEQKSEQKVEQIQDQKYYCTDCGAEFKGFTHSGKTYTAEQAYHMAEKKSEDGKARCKACRKKLNNKGNDETF